MATARADGPPASSADVELGDFTKRSALYVLRKTVREFLQDQCPDLAATLTYYSVLALFPAALALISLLGLVGKARDSVDLVLQVLSQIFSASTIDAVRPTLTELATEQSAGTALVLGLLGALWSASAYVNAFSRVMNRIYEIDEGRPYWKLRPTMIAITLLGVVLVAVALVILIVSGPVAEAIGSTIGVGETALLIWNIAKWPVLAVVVMLAVGLLYYTTPNVRQPKFRWVSPGSFLAILTWVAASAGFAVYVANFSRYNSTYGSLAGVIVFLLWLWLTNLALLFGAEVDAELERGRELRVGIPAEEAIQLPLRDQRKITKNRRQQSEDVAMGRAIRKKWERRAERDLSADRHEPAP